MPDALATHKRSLMAAGALVILALVIVFGGTTVVSKTEATKAQSNGRDPATFAEEYYSDIASQIVEQATSIVEVAKAIKADPDAATKQYGQQAGRSAPVFSVEATGVAGKTDSGGLTPIDVEGMPGDVEVYVQTGPAINGTAVRDATGTVKFGDFVNQMDYQAASTELNNHVKAKVLEGVDAAGLKGKTVTVVGAFQLGNPKAYIVTPVKIEVAP